MFRSHWLGLCSALVLGISAPGWAQSTPEVATEANETISPIDAVVGNIGIGYFTDFAPLGARYWFNESMAIDVGLDAALSTGDLEGHRIGVEAGFVYALASYHYSVVFTRLGLGFRTTAAQEGDASTDPRYDINLNAFLGAELFLGAFGFPNVSLQGGYALNATYSQQGTSTFVLGAANGGLSVVGSGVLGFHIYL